MLYNPFVTHVEIYVQQPSSKVAVQSVVANLVEEWRTTGSTQFAREFITSYSIQDFPPASKSMAYLLAVKKKQNSLSSLPLQCSDRPLALYPLFLYTTVVSFCNASARKKTTKKKEC